MRDLAVLFVVFAAIPFILRRPWIGILVWSWISYMNPHRLAWGFAYDFPFAQVIAVALFLGLMASKEPKQIPWKRETVVLLLFTIWMFISVLDAQFPALAWGQWDKVWKIQLITFLTLVLINSRERLQALIWVIALSLAFYGVKGGIFTLSTGGAHRVLGPPESFIGVRGGIALALNMTIPLLRYLQLTTPHRWVRLALTIAMGLTAFAIVGTQSRGGLLGLLAMSSVLLIKTRRSFFIAVLGTATAFAIYSFMPVEWKDRMATLATPAETAEEDWSARNRIAAWEWGAEKASQEPLTGGGFEVFVETGLDLHSIWFEVLAEQGYVGLALYLLLWLFTWRTATSVARVAKKRPDTLWLRDLTMMVQASLVAYAAGGTFLGLAYFDLFYHLVAVVVIAKLLLERALAEVSAEAGTGEVSGNTPPAPALDEPRPTFHR